jgi:ABC-2 type transport system ATP-binding protein
MQEAEAICDRVIIIDKGVIVADEEKNKIYSLLNRQKQTIHVEFNREADESELKNIPYVNKVQQIRKNFWLIEAEGEEDIRPAIFSFAVKNNLTVLSLQKEESNLEEVFRHLTKG